MRDDKHFNVIFIAMIQKYDILYNNKLKDYTNKKKLRAVWAAITKECNEVYGECCTIDECKSRWRVLRSSYVRYKNQLLKTPEGNSSKAPYYLADCMEFIDPYTKSRVREDEEDNPFKENVLEINDTTYDEELTNEVTSENASEDDGELEDTIETPVAPTIEPPVLKPIEPQMLKSTITNGSNVTNTTNITTGRSYKRRRERSTDRSSNEPTYKKSTELYDLYFLKSLLPHVVHFNYRQKLKFQRGVLELIENISNDSTEFVPARVESPSTGQYIRIPSPDLIKLDMSEVGESHYPVIQTIYGRNASSTSATVPSSTQNY